jgi:DNA invertase Pin-like site-specific DNA recombinase
MRICRASGFFRILTIFSVFTIFSGGRERRAASREARVARGLAATKPMKLDAAQQKRLLCLYQHGEPVSELTTLFGISRSTLFRTLKVLKQQPAPV